MEASTKIATTSDTPSTPPTPPGKKEQSPISGTSKKSEEGSTAKEMEEMEEAKREQKLSKKIEEHREFEKTVENTSSYLQSIIFFVVFVGALFTLGFGGYCNAAASDNISDMTELDTDANLEQARTYAIIASSICWIVFGLVLIFFVIYIVYRFRRRPENGNVSVFFVVSAIIMLLAIIAALILTEASFYYLNKTSTANLEAKIKALQNLNYAVLVESLSIGLLLLILLFGAMLKALPSICDTALAKIK